MDVRAEVREGGGGEQDVAIRRKRWGGGGGEDVNRKSQIKEICMSVITTNMWSTAS